MSDLETRLTAALHADSPPARDAMFRVEALVGLEQARFRRRVGISVLVAAVVAVAAAVSATALDVRIADVQQFGIVWSVALVAVIAALLGRPGGIRTLWRAVDRWLYS